jgi:hypothetical protein
MTVEGVSTAAGSDITIFKIPFIHSGLFLPSLTICSNFSMQPTWLTSNQYEQ